MGSRVPAHEQAPAWLPAISVLVFVLLTPASALVTHEYGHLKTSVAWFPTFSNDDVDYCYQDQNGCTLTWTEDSAEYQSVAALEGFAEFFSMLVWNDVTRGIDR